MGRRNSALAAALLAAACGRAPDPAPTPDAAPTPEHPAASTSAAAVPAEGPSDERLAKLSPERDKRLGIARVSLPNEPEPPRHETARAKARRRKRDIKRIRDLSGQFQRANESIEDALDKSVALTGRTAVMLARDEQGGALGPVELSSGVWAGAFGGDNETGARLLESAAAWSEAWGRLSSEPAPSVNFSRRRVAALFLGPRPTGGYRARLLAVEESAGAATVRWLEEGPRGAAPKGETAPYLLLSLPRDGRAVRWKQEKTP